MIRLAANLPGWLTWGLFAIWIVLAVLWMMNAPILDASPLLGWAAAISGILLVALIFEVLFLAGRKLFRRSGEEKQ